jgi:nucleoside-diphosphate-sugar epimerase
MNIVLTGSLGNISKPLAIELVSKGHTVTVISSKADRQKEIEALGAKAAIGSIEDADFLTKTFKGADIVYLMEPPFHFVDPKADTVILWKNIARCYVQAIKHAGVNKAVHLSSIGGHTDKGVGILASHYYVENILKELPDSVSIKTMRPVAFYGNLMANIDMIKKMSKGFIGGIIALQYYGIGGFLGGKRGVIMANCDGDVVYPLVSPLDIASVIAEEMEKTFEGRTVRYIASEEPTCSEVAEILGSAIGKPYLKHAKISDKMLADAIVKQGRSQKFANGIVEMYVAGRTGKLFEDYNKHRPALGKTKLKEFAKEFAKAYNKK